MDEEVNAFLEHFGIKGMHWGIRNERPGNVSRSVNRQARNDAEEFARAKAFFGVGAGNRRKIIKQIVEGKSKKIPGYKQAFDSHLNNQDLSKHASKAVSERTKIDRRDRNKKRTGAIARRITGEMGTQAAFVALAAGGAAYLRSQRGQAQMKSLFSKASSVSDKIKQQRGAAKVADLLKNMGGA